MNLLDKYLNGYSDKLSLGSWKIDLDKVRVVAKAQDPDFHPIKEFYKHRYAEK
jgi:hypothetical protein